MMVDKAQGSDVKVPADDSAVPAAGAPPTPPAPRRGPGHRGQDVRDTVAEMAARAQEISQEAGSKMASALKDVINAAAGLGSFAIESARDLVQYMVRRGQMTQEEADKLIREAEEAQKARPGYVPPAPRSESKGDSARKSVSMAAPAPTPPAPAPAARPAAAPPAAAAAPAPAASAKKSAPAAKAPPAAKKPAAAAAKSSTKASGKAATKKPAPKKK